MRPPVSQRHKVLRQLELLTEVYLFKYCAIGIDNLTVLAQHFKRFAVYFYICMTYVRNGSGRPLSNWDSLHRNGGRVTEIMNVKQEWLRFVKHLNKCGLEKNRGTMHRLLPPKWLVSQIFDLFH